MDRTRSNKFNIKHSLRLALTIPFVIIILATVGLTGYLAFTNGQTAVNDMGKQLFSEIESRVEQHLDNYLSTPFIINQINLNALRQGQFNSSDTEQMAQYFWQQGQLFKGMGSIGFANDGGELAAANEPEKYMIITHQSPTGIVLCRYAVGDDGRRTDRINREVQNFDVHARGWYQTAEKVKKPAWTEINPALTGPRLDVSAVTPYYDQEDRLAGVFYLDVSLSQINQFLGGINISRNGHIFIMEPNGFIVASSSSEKPYIIKDDQIERLNASSSSEPLIASASRYLQGQFADLGKIPSPYQSTFDIQGESNFLRVIPYRDERGLDWIIVLVVPASDLMAQISHNNRNTFVLITTSMLISIIVAALLARRITRPLADLSQSTKALAKGDYDQQLEIKNDDEVGELTDAFNKLAFKLKENSASLTRSEERFRALVEQAPEAILVYDVDMGVFVDANRNAEKLFGCTHEELLNSIPQRFYPSHQPDGRTIADSMKEYTQRALAGEMMSFERRIQSAHGIEYLCQVWLTRLPSIDRKLLRVSYIDITDRILAEEQNKMLRHSIDIFYDGIYWMDSNNKFIYVNDAGCKAFGYTREELMSMTVHDVNPKATQQAMKLVWEMLRKKGFFSAESVHRRKDGTEFPVELRSTYVQFAGREYIGGFARDISEQKRAEKERIQLIAREQKAIAEAEAARKLDRMKSMFIAGTSHELRTPLNSIIGFSSILIEGYSGELTPEQKEELEIIHSSGKHLLALINDIIDLSKIESGKIDPQISDFDLRDVVDEAISILGAGIKEKGLEVSFEGENISMRSDKIRLLQCILNLVGNAVKYTEKGSIKITAKIMDKMVHVSIIDSGIGIKEEDIQRLFSPFIRLESHLSLRTSGTGLGLYLTQKLTRDILGGEISVKSEYGSGSTFTLHIPVELGRN